MMVSTHQQYLCPDYLNPLPSTVRQLDSNKSPLALLAQTCNSIGLPDPSTSKAKPNVTENNSIKSDKNCKDDNNKGCKASSSQADSTSDAGESGKEKELTSEKKSDSRHQPNSTTTDDQTKTETTTTSSESTFGSSSDPKLSNHQTSSAALTVNPSLCSTSKCGTFIPPPGYPPHMFSHYFPPTSAAGYPYSHGVPSLPLSCYPGLQSSNIPMFPRLCTDPFCKSCPPNSTMASLNLTAPTMNGNGRACPYGCTQCTTHPADLSMWLNSYSLLNGGFHGLTNPSMPASLASLQNLQSAATSNSAALAAAAAAVTNPFMAHYPQNIGGQNIPPICWWNSGEGYCLKRFSSAEELLQHLKTHALESANKNSLMNAAASMPNQMASAAGRLSPRSSTYLNSLNSLRYHPYSKLSPTAPSMAPSASSLPHIPFPSLNAAAYSLQSSLYSGQRLPGSLPHP